MGCLQSELLRSSSPVADRVEGHQHLLIKQVAFECGFRSFAAFAAAFHRSTGRSPQEFRSANCCR
ncbi:helix-turn-helix domain-containing protein [Novosphingobium lentum]|uniref:helix-turn-helix domain-containing protein n=1 Tax=Novosphingobium lentum TaxID=145287 RepID=UPI000A99F20B